MSETLDSGAWAPHKDPSVQPRLLLTLFSLLCGSGQAGMDRLNAKLYLQNCYIMKENERLRKAALLLNQENQALLSELKHRLAKPAAAGAGAGNNNSSNGAAAAANRASPKPGIDAAPPAQAGGKGKPAPKPK